MHSRYKSSITVAMLHLVVVILAMLTAVNGQLIITLAKSASSPPACSISSAGPLSNQTTVNTTRLPDEYQMFDDWINNNQSASVGATVVFTCNEGHVFNEGGGKAQWAKPWVCGADSQWSVAGAGPADCEKACNIPPGNGIDPTSAIYSQPHPVEQRPTFDTALALAGTTAQFRCLDGYNWADGQGAGTDMRTAECKQDGEWNITCRQCPMPIALDAALMIDTSNIVYYGDIDSQAQSVAPGGQVQLQCRQPNNHTWEISRQMQPKNITCQANGSWETVVERCIPVCDISEAGPPSGSTTVNQTRLPDEYQSIDQWLNGHTMAIVGSSVRFACVKDHLTSDGDWLKSWLCTSNGQWQVHGGDDCFKACSVPPHPSVDNETSTYSAKIEHDYNGAQQLAMQTSTAELRCPIGYEWSHDSTARSVTSTCQPDATWDIGLKMCTASPNECSAVAVQTWNNSANALTIDPFIPGASYSIGSEFTLSNGAGVCTVDWSIDGKNSGNPSYLWKPTNWKLTCTNALVFEVTDLSDMTTFVADYLQCRPAAVV